MNPQDMHSAELRPRGVDGVGGAGHLESGEPLAKLYLALIRLVAVGHEARSRQELFDSVCRALVEVGPFSMAWVGWLDGATAEVRPVASAGDVNGYLGRVRIYADSRPEGRGPTGTALRENRTAICADISTEEWMEPWREALRVAGYRSSISIPIRRQGVAVGSMTAYSGAPGFFGAREVQLLEEAGLEVARGLVRLEVEDARRLSEQALRESEERLRLALQAANQGSYDLDLRTGEATVSPEYALLLGFDPSDFRESNAAWIERLHPDDRGPVEQAFREYVAGRRPEYRVEFRQRRRDGGWRWILSLGRVVAWDGEGRPVRMLGTHTDVTDRKLVEARSAEQFEELRRWHDVTLDRESRIVELKAEVNEALRMAGMEPRYRVSV